MLEASRILVSQEPLWPPPPVRPMSSTALKSIAFAAVLGTTPVSAALILTTGSGAPTLSDASSASDEWTPSGIGNAHGAPPLASAVPSASSFTLPADEGPQLFSRAPVVAPIASAAAVYSSHPTATSTPRARAEDGVIDRSPLAMPGGTRLAAGPVSFVNMTSYRTLLVLMPTAGDVAAVDSLQPLSIHPPASDGAPPPEGSTAAVTVPEPSTAILSLAAALTSLLQRRRR